MIKNLTALEIKIGERIYRLICDVDSPLGEAHDVLLQMKGQVAKMISDAHAADQTAAQPPVSTETIEAV